jgi:hypothetical protein
MCRRIDGLVLNADTVHKYPPQSVLAINYFGTVTLAEGLFPLLQKKNGRCAVTVSGSIAFLDFKWTKYFIDALLVNCGDEVRIARLVNNFPPMGPRPEYLRFHQNRAYAVYPPCRANVGSFQCEPQRACTGNRGNNDYG